ncbi:CDC14-domain-containing protein [Agrocybe pediades]|nr:CDC14-domain-containing protein [Agrocybe pediades]
MALDELMTSMKESLQGSLDELVSPRSTSKSKMQALQSVERHLAMACFVTKNDSVTKDVFVALQHTFECNVPSRLIPWLLISATKLEALTSKGVNDDDCAEVEQLVSQLSLALSLLQGVALIHEPSKHYLGRKSALEVLLEVFLASRHVPSTSDVNQKSKPTTTTPPHLSSITLDTLLCILVDSSTALRAFEEVNGIQSVVKILKRAGTPREVRMKCLEFLYFYLLDETPNSDDLKRNDPSPPPTRPATPIKAPKPYLSSTPMHPSSRYGSSTFSLSTSRNAMSTSTSSTASSRSTSGSSFCSTSSNASSFTAASSVPASPTKDAFPAALTRPPVKTPAKRITTPYHRSPPTSPPFSSAAKYPQLRSMMMLKKDVDYVPQSPKKEGLGARLAHRKSLSTSTISTYSRSRSQLSLSESKRDDVEANVMSIMDAHIISPTKPVGGGGNIPGTTENSDKKHEREGKWKTTEEKKELLGTMLGNVDALVEGVRKAGIWGLA